MRLTILGGIAALCLIATPALADGYPGKGRAIDQLRPASDYGDLRGGRPLALGIMRTRGNGFVPSPALQGYANGVLARLLKGLPMPASFQPQVRVLAAPEFSALCTPDGTIIITIGLLEQLDNEDQLAFILGHEVAHAIYRHHEKDWHLKTQRFAVVNGAALADAAVTVSAVGINIGGFDTRDIGRGLMAASLLVRLSAHVLAPQMSEEQEDEADALGFDLMVRAGYDASAAQAVMDKLAAQEAEAARSAKSAREEAKKAEKKKDSGGMFGGGLMGSLMSGSIADVALFALGSAVDDMSDEAVAHHPAPKRLELVSNYQFKQYRDTMPAEPTPLPWVDNGRSADGRSMSQLMAHYAAAENAAAYLADSRQGTAEGARVHVRRSSSVPTADHAYTQYVAYRYYEKDNQPGMSEAALQRAVKGPEASWEIYSRLIDLHIARNEWAEARRLIDEAGTRFEDSPVLLPKRIQILRGQGDRAGAKALLPKCKSHDIDELTDACQRAAG